MSLPKNIVSSFMSEYLCQSKTSKGNPCHHRARLNGRCKNHLLPGDRQKVYPLTAIIEVLRTKPSPGIYFLDLKYNIVTRKMDVEQYGPLVNTNTEVTQKIAIAAGGNGKNIAEFIANHHTRNYTFIWLYKEIPSNSSDEILGCYSGDELMYLI